MGDVILSTVLFEYISRKIPHTEITFITSPAWQPLFKYDSRLHKSFGIDLRSSSLPRELSAAKFDLILDLQNSARSRKFTEKKFAGVPVSRFDKLHLKRAALLYLRINRYDPALTVALRYIRIFDADASSENVPDTKIFTAASVKREKTIALFPFAAWRNKKWSEENYANVGKHFAAKGWKVLIFGGQSEMSDGKCLANLIGIGAENTAGRMSISETATAIAGCSIALGNDTGLSHLSMALGIPTGFIFGATTSHLGFFPQGSVPHTVFEHQMPCRPCHPHGGNICLIGRACLEGIKPEKVIEGLEQLAAIHIRS